jgi:cytochrome c-type biogenesis protein
VEDISIFMAFLAGVVSFLSPCVLPLVPAYLSYISGVSIEDISSSDRSGTAKVFTGTLAFVIGFSLVFISFGASASWIGRFFSSNIGILSKVGGAIVIIFGLHLIGVFRIPFLYREKRYHSSTQPASLFGSLLVGVAFAFGWTPCIGPILAGILAYAGTQETVREGVILLSFYSLGLGVPFLLTGMGVSRFLSVFDVIKRHFRAIEITSGVLLIIVGLMIFTDNFRWLAGQLSFLNLFSL